MFLRNFSPNFFLRKVFGTPPFVEYCRKRGIAFAQAVSSVLQKQDLQRWVAALRRLPREQQARVELELATVNEMASRESLTQLLSGLKAQQVPSDGIPGDTALSLWFFLRHPDLFHDVFLHQEILETDAWWDAQAPPGIVLADLPARAAALVERLQATFRDREGTGRFCAVDPHEIDGAYCFVVHVADRLRVLDVFTENGELASHTLQPALPAIFVYYPLDGSVLLQTGLKSRDRILELFQVFAQAVLGVELTEACMEYVFDLDCLKRRFDPLADAADMELVRVKTLHLRYPPRSGRRLVTLETLASDEQFAILQLILAHMNPDSVLGQLQVSYAELQVRLKVEGGAKCYTIGLWPNRCNLDQSPLGNRFRDCLKRWGLYRVHARKH